MGKYKYHVYVAEGYTKEKPSAVYRAPKDNPLYLEVLQRDGKWHLNHDVIRAFMNGDTLMVEEVTQEEGERAAAYLLKVMKGRKA